MRFGRGFAWMMVVLFGVCCGLAVGCDSSPVEPEPPTLRELFGDSLYRSDGSTVTLEALNGVPLIGIYFGHQGCPACAAFTPILVDAYGRLRDQGKGFEVVYVSLDSTETAMFSYMTDAGMEWLAVPWRSHQSAALLHRYEVQWIPTLVVIDSTGRTVSLEGSDELRADGVAAYDDWLTQSAGS